MAALILVLATLISARGYGRSLLVLARTRLLPTGERELLSLGLGLGAVAYLVLSVGLLGWLSAPVVALVLLAGIALNGPGGVTEFLQLRSAARCAWKWVATLSPIERVLAAALLAQVTLNMVAALAPPTGVDPLVYHLAVPRLYVLEGSIGFVPGNYYASQPSILQMLYTAMLALGSDTAAQVLHWAMGLICLFALALLGRAWRSPGVPLAAAALFYSISDVAVQSGLALIDLGAAAFFLLAVLALLGWVERRTSAHLMVAGLLAGAYAASRLTNPVGVTALAAGLALVATWKGHSSTAALRGALAFGLVAFVTVLPWYLKSWALSGNPVYPFLYDWFGGRALLPSQAADIFQAQYHDVDAGYTVLDLLLVPLTLTFNPDRLHSGQLGPLFLGLLPMAMAIRHPLHGRWFLLTALVFLPLWFWSYPRLRTLLPALALIALPLGAGWWTLVLRRSRWVSAVGVAVMGAWLAVSLVANVRFHGPALAAGLGLERREAYLARVLPAPPNSFPWYRDFRMLSEQLPVNARVMIWDTRGYYLERPTVWARALAQSLPRDQQHDPTSLVQQARSFGVTHFALPREALADEEFERLRLAVLRSRELESEVETPRLVAYRLVEPEG